MGYGFIVKNLDDKVLVHSDAENMFFVGKVTLSTTTQIFSLLSSADAATHVGSTDTVYKEGSVTVKIPKTNPNVDSMVFFPFIDVSTVLDSTSTTATSIFSYAFALQKVESVFLSETTTHKLYTINITVLVGNSTVTPVMYLFSNSPEVEVSTATSSTEVYGVEVYKDTPVVYKVYDSSKTPLVITGTYTVKPYSTVQVQDGRDNLKIDTNTDIQVGNASNTSLVYCPIQADGGAYKAYNTTVKIANCSQSYKVGIDIGEGYFKISATKTVCTADTYKTSAYGFYAYYKSAFIIRNNTLYLTYVPVLFRSASDSVTFYKARSLSWFESLSIAVTDLASLPIQLLTDGFSVLDRFTSAQLSIFTNSLFGTAVPTTFVKDTLNRTRNSDHEYLVLLADKTLYG